MNFDRSLSFFLLGSDDASSSPFAPPAAPPIARGPKVPPLRSDCVYVPSPHHAFLPIPGTPPVAGNSESSSPRVALLDPPPPAAARATRAAGSRARFPARTTAGATAAASRTAAATRANATSSVCARAASSNADVEGARTTRAIVPTHRTVVGPAPSEPSRPPRARIGALGADARRVATARGIATREHAAGLRTRIAILPRALRQEECAGEALSDQFEGGRGRARLLEFQVASE